MYCPARWLELLCSRRWRTLPTKKTDRLRAVWGTGKEFPSMKARATAIGVQNLDLRPPHSPISYHPVIAVKLIVSSAPTTMIIPPVGQHRRPMMIFRIHEEKKKKPTTTDPSFTITRESTIITCITLTRRSLFDRIWRDDDNEYDIDYYDNKPWTKKTKRYSFIIIMMMIDHKNI